MKPRYIIIIITLLLFITIQECHAKMEFHHIFPNQFSEYWQKHDINHHLYCIPINDKMHDKLHSKEFNYNGKWKQFIDKNPDASKEMIFGFAGLLLMKAGLRKDIDLYDYKSKKSTGEKFELKKWVKIGLQKGVKLSFAKRSTEFVKKAINKIFSAKRSPKVIKRITTYAAVGAFAGAAAGGGAGGLACSAVPVVGTTYGAIVGAIKGAAIGAASGAAYGVLESVVEAIYDSFFEDDEPEKVALDYMIDSFTNENISN